MNIRYLLDENLDPLYKTQLLAKMPSLIVYAINDPGSPVRGTLDPEILAWCEENGFLLITNNRKSMPTHLTAHLAQGRHIPGIITLHPEMSIGETIEELIMIAEVGTLSDYQDHIEFLSAT